MDMAKTTIDYKYLPVLVARLVGNNESFIIAHAGSGDTDVEVHAQMRQRALDEAADEAHGGLVISVECSDVWQIAYGKGYDIDDSRHDAAEAAIASAGQNLVAVWGAINEAIDAGLADYCGEKK